MDYQKLKINIIFSEGSIKVGNMKTLFFPVLVNKYQGFTQYTRRIDFNSRGNNV